MCFATALFPCFSTAQSTKPKATGKPAAYRVYHDSEFGFSFSYPPPDTNREFYGPLIAGETQADAIERVDGPKINTMPGRGRCVVIDHGYVILACGEIFATCLAGITNGLTIPNLKGAYEDWAREMRMGGIIQGIHIGNNWFLGRSIQQPNMFNPEAVIVVRKGYAGECLANYIQVSFLAKNDAQHSSMVSRLMESFHPGEMDTRPH